MNVWWYMYLAAAEAETRIPVPCQPFVRGTTATSSLKSCYLRGSAEHTRRLVRVHSITIIIIINAVVYTPCERHDDEYVFNYITSTASRGHGAIIYVQLGWHSDGVNIIHITETEATHIRMHASSRRMIVIIIITTTTRNILSPSSSSPPPPWPLWPEPG